MPFDILYPDGFVPAGGPDLWRVGDHAPCCICGRDTHWFHRVEAAMWWVCGEECLQLLRRCA